MYILSLNDINAFFISTKMEKTDLNFQPHLSWKFGKLCSRKISLGFSMVQFCGTNGRVKSSFRNATFDLTPDVFKIELITQEWLISSLFFFLKIFVFDLYSANFR